jgi:hypothetical protein
VKNSADPLKSATPLERLLASEVRQNASAEEIRADTPLEELEDREREIAKQHGDNSDDDPNGVWT